jgi:hypothetical protein
MIRGRDVNVPGFQSGAILCEQGGQFPAPVQDFGESAGNSSDVKDHDNRGGTVSRQSRGNASVMQRTASSAPADAPMAMTGNSMAFARYFTVAVASTFAALVQHYDALLLHSIQPLLMASSTEALALPGG